MLSPHSHAAEAKGRLLSVERTGALWLASVSTVLYGTSLVSVTLNMQLSPRAWPGVCDLGADPLAVGK